MTDRPVKLACSRSKADFLTNLGLRENEDGTVELYKAMMNEAAEGRDRITDNPNNLKPDAREADPPYSFNSIVPDAIDKEVTRIYWSASPETRLYYDLAIEWRGKYQDNWMVRWCLWHVFRYRDDRNRSRTAMRPSAPDDNTDEYQSNQSGSSSQRQSRSNMPYYDPVRDV